MALSDEVYHTGDGLWGLKSPDQAQRLSLCLQCSSQLLPSVSLHAAMFAAMMIMEQTSETERQPQLRIACRGILSQQQNSDEDSWRSLLSVNALMCYDKAMVTPGVNRPTALTTHHWTPTSVHSIHYLKRITNDAVVFIFISTYKGKCIAKLLTAVSYPCFLCFVTTQVTDLYPLGLCEHIS